MGAFVVFSGGEPHAKTVDPLCGWVCWEAGRLGLYARPDC